MIDKTSPIFDTQYIYPVTVPYICTLPKDDVSEYGLRTTGVEELDENLDTMPTNVYLTINQMIEIYREHYPINIMNTKVSAQVYEAIILYTQAWKDYLSTHSMNRSIIPVDDLILMEEFAAAMRPHAVDGKPAKIISRSFNNLLGGLLEEDEVEPDLEHQNQLLELFKDYKTRHGVG